MTAPRGSLRFVTRCEREFFPALTKAKEWDKAASKSATQSVHDGAGSAQTNCFLPLGSGHSHRQFLHPALAYNFWKIVTKDVTRTPLATIVMEENTLNRLAQAAFPTRFKHCNPFSPTPDLAVVVSINVYNFSPLCVGRAVMEKYLTKGLGMTKGRIMHLSNTEARIRPSIPPRVNIIRTSLAPPSPTHFDGPRTPHLPVLKSSENDRDVRVGMSMCRAYQNVSAISAPVADSTRQTSV
ncbi:hypothetical protein IW261DRAFT_1564165 [Armillaria novae-zelandiae]|uniref:Uncharacterized protein n=1 Tax=Armillaria novae-zelandiae TaxID=153914 RepID=A0AA39P8F6_9AGAR|nr:hypothetical protein IW261DRAFT_1564165 [Armillaria novae-zelandiae]